MNIIITPLGCGAAVPALGRHCSGQMVNVDGCRLLFDCGESTQEQLRRYHQRMQSVEAIFITHLHGDHVFGLPGLVSSMHLCGRKEPLQIFSPEGLREPMELFMEASATTLQYEVQWHALDSEAEKRVVFENAKCRVWAFPLYHSVPALGYLVEEVNPLPGLRHGVRNKYKLNYADIVRIKNGEDYVDSDGVVHPNSELLGPPRKAKSYAYCCDTGYNEAIARDVHDVDLLCMESTFADNMMSVAEEKRHCTASQAARVALAAGARKLMLTHFSARYNTLDGLLEEARAIFPETILAEEGEPVMI